MSAITQFTCEISDRLLKMSKIETAPVVMVYSCGIDATIFFLASNNQPNPIFQQVAGSGYARVERQDINRLETGILNSVQAFGESVVLRKLSRQENTGEIAKNISDDEKSSLIQIFSSMLNSTIGEDGDIASSQENLSNATIVLLIAYPNDNSSFTDRLISKFKEIYKRFSFTDISPEGDSRFSYLGIYGTQSR